MKKYEEEELRGMLKELFGDKFEEEYEKVREEFSGLLTEYGVLVILAKRNRIIL
ncbi:hypothetical protein ACPB8Q_05110 [Methanocaldococcus indicus]|uniref:hypothetical protein n=1 Tax=Methanocaldococcus indicus TaxID=213231 RepID=UPI003C6D1DEF